MIAPTWHLRRLTGLDRLWRVQTLRRLTQAGVAGFIAAVVANHLLAGEGRNAASGEAFCPFGGLETLYTYVTTGGTVISHTHLSNLVILVAVLALTVVARGAFCGWLCPFGALQEWLHAGSVWLRRRVPPLRRLTKRLETWAGGPIRPVYVATPARPTIAQLLDRWLRLLKYVILAWALIGAAVTGTMVIRGVDPWAALITVGEPAGIGGLIVLAIVAVASLFVNRPWCRYACPLGAAIGLIGQVSPLRLQRQGDQCLGCSLCHRACPMGLAVERMSDVTSPDCIMCLECAGSCPNEATGALGLKLVLPVRTPAPAPLPGGDN